MPNMIAAVPHPDRFCIIQKVWRQGLKVKSKSWCGGESDVGAGVVQIPDNTPKICAACQAALTEFTAGFTPPRR